MEKLGGGRPLFVAAVLALAGASCRETVVLEQDGPDGGGGDGGLGNCQLVQASLRAPYLVILLDRSTAMSTAFGSGTRLSAAEQQILAVVGQYPATVRVGYGEFPAPAGACQNAMGCCAGGITSPTRFATTAIMHTMGFCDNAPGSCVSTQRPLADALAGAGQVYATTGTDQGEHHYVMVVTGGEPNCGQSFGGSACMQAETQAANLNNANSRTMVVGVGDDVATSPCLDDIALAGGTARGMSPFYYLARTPSELHDQMNALVQGMAEEACKIDLRGSIGDASKVTVLLNNVAVPHDGVNGWDLDSTSGFSRTITLHNGSCDMLTTSKNADPVEVFVNCGR
jgi:hypothetical protein